MSDFKHKFTQVLGLISQAKKEQLLTDEERKKIKENIISEEPDLTTEMEKYNKDKDLSGLVETLFQKKRDQQHKKKKKNDDKDKTKSNTEEDDVDVQINECEIGNSPVFQPKTLKRKAK